MVRNIVVIFGYFSLSQIGNFPKVSLGRVESFETLPIFTVEGSLGKRNYREAERLIGRRGEAPELIEAHVSRTPRLVNTLDGIAVDAIE